VRDWEPRVALFGGPSGLEIYGGLIADAARVLRPGGRIAMELGFHTCERVAAMLGSGWDEVEVIPDLAGIPRVLAARVRPPA
jgi:release factor glutamine methyltransferase